MGRKKKIKVAEEINNQQQEKPEVELNVCIDAFVVAPKLSMGEGKIKRKLQKIAEMREDDGIRTL